jgi:hypothetical protein
MRVFISYTHEDKELAGRIAHGLQREGLDVWYGETELLPGDNFAQKMSEALESSDAMVVVITPDALQSPWVRREIEFALGNIAYRGRVIPVLAGRMEEVGEEQVPWILRKLQMVKLSDAEEEDEGINRIATVLRKAS